MVFSLFVAAIFENVIFSQVIDLGSRVPSYLKECAKTTSNQILILVSKNERLSSKFDLNH